MHTSNTFLRIGTVCLLLGLCAILSGCGKDKPTPPVTGDLTDINAYLSGLPSWRDFANVADTSDVATGSMTASMATDVLRTSTPYSITQNPQQISTFGSALNVLYLGSLIQGETYLDGLGSMMELPIQQRAPLIISVILSTATTLRDTVANPDGASVQMSLDTIIANATAGGHLSGDNVYYDQRETYSLRQATLRLGMSFEYMDALARNQLVYSAAPRENTVTAYFKQIMYEAHVAVPQTPAHFFSTAFTTAKLQEQVTLGNIGPGNLPVYVGKIEYGRMIVFTMTSTAPTDSMKRAIKASYEGFGQYSPAVEARLREILQSADCTMATVGGDRATALTGLKDGTLAAYFATDDALALAEPMAHTLYGLADGSVATVSETTTYDLAECSGVYATAYTNSTEWENAVIDLVGDGHTIELLTHSANICSYTLEFENSSPPFPENKGLGPTLTFDSFLTGYAFTFRLKALLGNLVYDDYEGGPYRPAFGAYQERSLSIGEVDDQENDDFEIAVTSWNTNAAVFAIGITVGNNVPEYNEGATVDGVDGFHVVLPNSVPSCSGKAGFLGVVASVPLTRLFFNENGTGNDIFVRDFRFGVLEW